MHKCVHNTLLMRETEKNELGENFGAMSIFLIKPPFYLTQPYPLDLDILPHLIQPYPTLIWSHPDWTLPNSTGPNLPYPKYMPTVKITDCKNMELQK